MIIISFLNANENIQQTYFQLSNNGFEFVPYDQQALLLFDVYRSILTCIQQCFRTIRCRTFNYDTTTKYCSLYEGDVNTTGRIQSSLSSYSHFGYIQLTLEDFLVYGQSCSFCENHRYLTCLNSTCQCENHTYFDGLICRSQKLNGSICSSDIECRNDLNFTCSSNNQCSSKSTNTQIMTTSKHTTIDSHSSMNTAITSSPITTIITTMTTVNRVNPCNSSCLNQSWHSFKNRLAEWLFDGNYLDQMNNYNAIPSTNMSFITNGYVNQGLIFANNTNSMLKVGYIPNLNVSFTIDYWLYMMNLQDILNIGIFELCSQLVTSKCLILRIGKDGISNNYYSYFSFFGDDCKGILPLSFNSWIHMAFVFDYSTLTKTIYVNGIFDISCNSISSFLSSPANITIGYTPVYATTSNISYFQGYMDQMIISNRIKSACEIFEIATLVTYFTFDTGLFSNDSGPNSLQSITEGTVSTSSGRYSQAISFIGFSYSYFQIKGLTGLGITNQSFSISLWIRPIIRLGTVVHLSTSTLGTEYCFPLLGFNINGTLYAQIYTGSSIVSIGNQSIDFPVSVWSHIVQTWSSTNGLRLYVNNILIASYPYFTFIGNSKQNYLTLGSMRNGTAICNTSNISTSSYRGDLDDFRVYNRELCPNDINNLYGNDTITVAPYLLTSSSETVNGIYKTVVGGSSSAATSGTGMGQYYPSDQPANVFDGNLLTSYTSYGNCTGGFDGTSCGIGTGFYFTAIRGLSLLLSFRFGTGINMPGRDPLTVTIEGTNSAALTIGSSWTLIYNGVTGLSSDPGRTQYGSIQNISNSIWYTSYRFLITSKRNGGVYWDSTRYTEVQLFGY